MVDRFQSIIAALIQPQENTSGLLGIDAMGQLDERPGDDAGTARSLNAAFFIALAGAGHTALDRAKELLLRMADSPAWADVAEFYLRGLDLVRQEVAAIGRRDAQFSQSLNALFQWVSSQGALDDADQTMERVWSVFFPEATGIRGREAERVTALRDERLVTITRLCADPISDPARQMLFTSNVLLTVPPTSKGQDELWLSDALKEKLFNGPGGPQLYWYDHPIQIGVEPDRNEILYGLSGLDEAVQYEFARGDLPQDAALTCVLSISVTHRSLEGIAKEYLHQQISRSGGLKHLDVYAFTEADSQRIIDELLVPAASHYLQRDDAKRLLGMFGVDGEYGRHYSFLKAIAVFWSVFLNPEIRATFKIDLDQVFPQRELVAQTGASAFEHFTTPLWGAQGVDRNGQPVELGMIAGAAVNESDIGRSLFTPDVPFPRRALAPDERVFFSPLPQALSTEAEMMVRYTDGQLDGRTRCLTRIHALGGLNGILVESLRRHRPFTPSFFGRAEDQAYLLSAWLNPGTRLAYVHKDGLIMRHDKEAFAQEAIRSAYVGRLIGDYVRILYFSAYARALAGDPVKLKNDFGPFTGCFISRIPTTVVYLRFALKAASFFAAGEADEGLEFVTQGSRRITAALQFAQGENSRLGQVYQTERLGWNLYYDTLGAVEEALGNDDRFARALRDKAKRIAQACSVSAG